MKKTKNTNYVKLKVAEPISDDTDKGIARLDPFLMNKLELKPGDVVEVKGKRKTATIVKKAYPKDIGVDVIRMDKAARKNAGTAIGEWVLIKKQ